MNVPHVIQRHGQSLLTGEPVVFYEEELRPERGRIVRSMLGWPVTTYPMRGKSDRGLDAR